MVSGKLLHGRAGCGQAPMARVPAERLRSLKGPAAADGDAVCVATLQDPARGGSMRPLGDSAAH